jgi:ElaB/YqjD/DUF883 family membrane-anchored ribosome-binding protein
MTVTRKSDKDDDAEAMPSTESLQAEMAALRADVAELGMLVSRIGRKRAAGLKMAAGETARDGYAKGEAALDDIVQELQSLEEELADAARRRPFAAIGLATLFGFLLGVFFRR